MKIAYIPHYQGPVLLKNRPCLNNLSLGSKAKVELIAQLLRKGSHAVEIISNGEVDAADANAKFKFFPRLEETQRFDDAIPVTYASALSVRYLAGVWSAASTLRLFKEKHRESPFDAVIVQTLKPAQLACARYARERLRLPVILEYEDDTFVNVIGKQVRGVIPRYHRYRYRQALSDISGCMAVSPHLLSQFPSTLPKLLLRGIVSPYIVSESSPSKPRQNRVVFSGTHEGTQGLAAMVKAWQMLRPQDWELHIAGVGPITETLRQLAGNEPTIVFHGLLNSDENARLLCSARIGMNPQDVTHIPGTSFAFKIIEYLAAGLHVITTPRGALEPELEAGVSYINDNTPDTIAASLNEIINKGGHARTARGATLAAYGPDAVVSGLSRLVRQVIEAKGLPVAV